MERVEDGHGKINGINLHRFRISPVVGGCAVLSVVFRGLLVFSMLSVV